MTQEQNNKNKAGVRPANKRGLSRLAAVQALYQMELAGTELSDIVGEFKLYRLGQELDGETYREADPAWFQDLVHAVFEEQKIIDAKIHSGLSEDWPLRRVDSTVRAILRVGAAELLRKKDVPAKVIINEYIEISKAFYEKDETRLVNGIMNRLARDIRASEFDG
ncbi:transcription antitermination factor NusB [Flexibacterium corallicola]|uniref:transcription antitermination factor NusB n=1 Tax=Flexibacterium corallicola TaxID=3037259 RepID=UPI00286EBDDA|nr:transcription antitermination factor NusB [Pseudovibrio sp. M1P-2-3]